MINCIEGLYVTGSDMALPFAIKAVRDNLEGAMDYWMRQVDSMKTTITALTFTGRDVDDETEDEYCAREVFIAGVVTEIKERLGCTLPVHISHDKYDDFHDITIEMTYPAKTLRLVYHMPCTSELAPLDYNPKSIRDSLCKLSGVDDPHEFTHDELCGTPGCTCMYTPIWCNTITYQWEKTHKPAVVNLGSKIWEGVDSVIEADPKPKEMRLPTYIEGLDNTFFCEEDVLEMRSEETGLDDPLSPYYRLCSVVKGAEPNREDCYRTRLDCRECHLSSTVANGVFLHLGKPTNDSTVIVGYAWLDSRPDRHYILMANKDYAIRGKGGLRLKFLFSPPNGSYLYYMNKPTTELLQGTFMGKETCAICLEVTGDRIIKTVCGHHFCSPCINKWLETRNVCPYCRTKEPLIKF